MDLCYVSVEEDVLVLLGRDNDIVGDWENGLFSDNFRGVWAAIDGCYCYMDIIEEGDGYNLYSTPIYLNGEPYNLHSVYDFTEEEYRILGVRQGSDETGMSDRNIRKLEPGDEISTVYFASPFMEDGETTEFIMDTFTVTEDTCMEELWLGDGAFVMMFEMVDYSGKEYTSDLVVFEIIGEDIYTMSFDEYLESYFYSEDEYLSEEESYLQELYDLFYGYN